MDLFAHLSHDEFIARLEDAGESNSDVARAMKKELRRFGSINFTAWLRKEDKQKPFRINAAHYGNGAGIRLVARSLSSSTTPSLKKPVWRELEDAWSKSDANSEDQLWLSMPAVALYESLATEGLIIVFGGTGSGKSYLADELAFNVIADRLGTGGHVLRYGDPVEGSIGIFVGEFVASGNLSSTMTETQRNDPQDVKSIAQFGRDALRQKPTVVTLAELRDEDQIRDAIELASTGHTVVATAHAGSLNDGFVRLMKAYKCSEFPDLITPLVKSLNTVIHLEPVDTEDRRVRLVLPTIWTRTVQTEYPLLAEGIASIRPGTRTSDMCKAPSFFWKDRVSTDDNLDYKWLALGLTALNLVLTRYPKDGTPIYLYSNAAESVYDAACKLIDPLLTKFMSEMIPGIEPHEESQGRERAVFERAARNMLLRKIDVNEEHANLASLTFYAKELDISEAFKVAMAQVDLELDRFTK